MTQKQDDKAVKVNVELEGEKREYLLDGFILIGCTVTDEEEKYHFEFAANMPLEIGAIAIQDVLDERMNGKNKIIVPDEDKH